MKINRIATALVLMGLAAGANAGKTPDQLRVYINPGHGSWTGNDRPMQVIGKSDYSSTNTDTTGFFESNTNLQKGLAMLEKLVEMGMPFDRTLNQTGERWEIGAARDLSQNIVMSRVKNGPFEATNTTSSPNYMLYNRALLEIATEVEYNEFDQFVSIHSNAASIGSTVNYHLYMYRGKNGKENVLAPGSWEMIEAAAKYSFPNPHAAWSASYTYINGDIDFMGGGDSSTNSLGYTGYLGVLKHGTPGYLVEGYFHTYLPATHRGMNFDVDQIEGYQYARGVAEYWEFATRDASGEIYGIVRDQHERFTHALYKPNPQTDDIYKPLNGVQVTLTKDGAAVAEYTTDEFYNGAFVFKGLTPGTYEVTFSHPEYKESEPVEVEVKAGATSYPKAFLEALNYEEPVDKAYNYPDPLSSFGALSPVNEYVMTAEYTDAEVPGLGNLIVKRVLVRDQKMYILAHDKEMTIAANVPVEDQPVATILVYDLAKKEVVATVSTEGAAGSIAAISDIQLTADGYLLACNATKNQYDASQIQDGDAGRGTFYIYKWAKDAAGLPTGDPEKWLSTQNSGLWYRAYPTRFAYSGTTEEGQVLIPMPTITAPEYKTRATYLMVMEGKAQTSMDLKPVTPLTINGSITSMNLFCSPLSDNQYLLLDRTLGASAWDFKEGFETALDNGNDLLSNIDSRAGIFKYAGASYIVTSNTGDDLKLINITKGLSGATEATVTLTEELGAAAATHIATAGEVVVTRDDFSGEVTSGWMNLYLLRDGKITKVTTKGVNQPMNYVAGAYDLNCSADYTFATGDTGYELSYRLSGPATASRIILTPMEGFEGEPVVIEMGGGEAGELISYGFDRGDLNYDANWAVEVESAPVGIAGEYFADATAVRPDGSRGGVISFNDPTMPNFGKVLVTHSYAGGFDVFGGDGTKLQSNMHKGSPFVSSKINSPIRGDSYYGYGVVVDWSDANAGYYVIDPENPESAPVQMLSGTRDGTGAFTYDGKIIGGGSSCVAFRQHENGTYMYTFEEDCNLIKSNGDNLLVRYDLDKGATTITEGPATDFGKLFSGSSYLSSTNVDITTYPGGFIASQLVSEGNHSSDKPCFLVISDEGEILFNSASLEDLESCNSATALSQDMATLAVGTHKGIRIYDVKWNEGKPAMTFKYQIPSSDATWADLDFDYAGNLHAYLLNRGYRVYSLVNAAPKVTIAGPGFIGAMVSVDSISLDANNAEAVYYNLQGVRVDSSNLVPGIYVVVRGNESQKVIVK